MFGLKEMGMRSLWGRQRTSEAQTDSWVLLEFVCCNIYKSVFKGAAKS